MSTHPASLNSDPPPQQPWFYARGLDWQLILVGIVLIAWGQLQLTQGGESSGFFGSGRIFLILGFGVVTAATFLFKTRLRSDKWRADSPRILHFNLSGLRKIPFGIGVVALAFLVLRLFYLGSTSGNDIWVWLITLIGFSIPFVPSLSRVLVGLRRARRSIRWIDVVIVSVLVAIFIGYIYSDLTDWYHSIIGDEYGFYLRATDFVENGVYAPFAQRGVDGYHPNLGTLMKSLVMSVIGTDHFGWKFSSVLMFALSIPAVYLTGTLIGGRVAGAVAAATLAFSHYLMSLTHTGYNHIDSLFIVTWAFALFFLAMRTKSPMLFFVAGTLAGLCIYTNISARVIYPVIFAFAVWMVLVRTFSIKNMWNWGLPLIVGATVAALPIFLVENTEMIGPIFDRLVGGQHQVVEVGIVDVIARNVELNLFAFNSNDKVSHWVSGSLLDPLSAIVAVVALAFALGRITDHVSVFLLIWFAIGFVGLGALSPHDHVVVSRMFPLIIPLSLAMGLFVSKFVWPIEINVYSPSGSSILGSKAITIIALILVGGLVLMLNYQRYEYDTPSVYHTPPPVVAIGALREHCANVPLDRVAFISRDQHMIRLALNSYEPGSIQLDPNATQSPGQPLFLDNQQVIEQGLGQADRYSCIIFSHPWEPEPAKVLEDLQTSNLNGVVIPFSDPSGITTISIFKS